MINILKIQNIPTKAILNSLDNNINEYSRNELLVICNELIDRGYKAKALPPILLEKLDFDSNTDENAIKRVAETAVEENNTAAKEAAVVAEIERQKAIQQEEIERKQAHQQQEAEREKARQQEEIEREEAQRQEAQKQHALRVEQLRKNGYDGYYEYKVINIYDDNSGSINVDTLTHTLNELAMSGWKVVCSFANEVGHNTVSAGIGGLSTGKNATIDQNIIILERFIKLQ